MDFKLLFAINKILNISFVVLWIGFLMGICTIVYKKAYKNGYVDAIDDVKIEIKAIKQEKL